MNTKKYNPLLALLLASISLPALAERDGKVYAASQCQPSDYSAYRLFKHHNGKVYNSYRSAKWLVCPLVKDLFSSKKVSNIKVSVIDNNFAAGDPKVKCGIFISHYNGDAYRSAWAYSKSGASAGVQELIIPSVSTTYASYQSLYAGFQSLVCVVPGYHHVATRDTRYSSVLSYRVTEED